MHLICRPILLLVCLPALLTFYYYKTRLDAESLLLRVVVSSSASSQWSAAGGYYMLVVRSAASNASSSAKIYSKPRDLFYPVEGASSIYIREAAGEPSCLHHSSPTIAPICSTAGHNNKLEGNYYDAQGQVLISVARIQRQITMAVSSKNNWKLVIENMPATCLMIGLNAALAYVYWDRTVDPLSVANIYDSMVYYPFEIWRIFTGATAHFEIWHLGLNLMSFSALGRDVEPRITSVVFFLYNISLMPIVATLWLGASSIQRGNQRAPTVGYSGVLFAWMVVASLEQSQTCPVVFFPRLCFRTYKMGGFKFNLGPLVQLIVMQVLVPRASFYGHLAGILAGFLMHWGLLPIRVVQPSVLLPFLYSLYLQFIRRIKFRDLLSTRCVLSLSDQICLAFQASLLGISAYFLRWESVLDLGMTTSYWIVARLIGRDSIERHMMIKATVFFAVIVIASDAIKLGFFLALTGLISPSTITLVLRTTGLFALLVSSGVSELEVDDGIFERTLSFAILDFCRAIERPAVPSRITLPTSDDGHRLGGNSSGGNHSGRPVSRLLETV